MAALVVVTLVVLVVMPDARMVILAVLARDAGAVMLYAFVVTLVVVTLVAPGLMPDALMVGPPAWTLAALVVRLGALCASRLVALVSVLAALVVMPEARMVLLAVLTLGAPVWIREALAMAPVGEVIALEGMRTFTMRILGVCLYPNASQLRHPAFQNLSPKSNLHEARCK